MPIFSSSRETSKPGTWFPRRPQVDEEQRDSRRGRASGSVFATMRMKSARAPLVMNVFEPEIT